MHARPLPGTHVPVFTQSFILTIIAQIDLRVWARAAGGVSSFSPVVTVSRITLSLYCAPRAMLPRYTIFVITATRFVSEGRPRDAPVSAGYADRIIRVFRQETDVGRGFPRRQRYMYGA
jgi:hypothetical protein